MKKKRILMVSEASYTLSGYGTYTKEVLSRLHKTGKYEIAEFASYAHVNDPRDKAPWRIYPNGILPNDPRNGELNSKPFNQFGMWRFERVLLDFKPDIVFDIRDPWMFMYQNNSPLRKYFHWAIMPTVDSAPQQEEWIQNFIEADGVFTYSDFGYDTLKTEGGGLVKLVSPAPPGANLIDFKPILNKTEHRRKWGFPEDVRIIGTVMRNQRRKLFPDLMVAFNLYLDKCRAEGRDDLARKSFLYFHTSYPDVVGCWNIPRLIKEKGLGSKILFTYMCKDCGNVFPALFQDARTVCPRCHKVGAMLPSVGSGLSTAQLGEVMNLFDVYVQYATCEGFGMPQVEAASCGVPVMATDYSAMSDVSRKLKGWPIKVARMVRSVEEDADKALPDNNDFADKAFKFLSQPQSVRQERGLQARAAVEEHYTWDKTAKIWEDYFDSVELKGLQGKWDAPPQFLNPRATPEQCPQNLTNQEFIEWMVMYVLGDESKLNSIMTMDMNRALNYELSVLTSHHPTPFTRKHVVDKVMSMVVENNHLESLRCGFSPLSQEDYIEYANRRAV